MKNKTPNAALIGPSALQVSRVAVDEVPPGNLSDRTTYQFTLVTSRGEPSKQFTLWLDEELTLELCSQLITFLRPDDDNPAVDWLANHEAMELLQAAGEISHLIGENDALYEQWVEEADRLEDAINKIEGEQQNDNHS